MFRSPAVCIHGLNPEHIMTQHPREDFGRVAGALLLAGRCYCLRLRQRGAAPVGAATRQSRSHYLAATGADCRGRDTDASNGALWASEEANANGRRRGATRSMAVTTTAAHATTGQLTILRRLRPNTKKLRRPLVVANVGRK